jgi:hypothetical protein
MKTIQMVWLSLALAAFPSLAAHKVQVSDPALARELAGKGARLLADYGGWQLYEVDQVPPGLFNRPQAEDRDRYNVIELNAGPIDTTSVEAKALRKARGDFAGKRMHLVQFAGPPQPVWHEALAGTGVRIVTYIPENAYLVYGSSEALARVQQLARLAPHIQWDGEYLEDYRIHPRAQPMDKAGKAREIGTDLFAIQLVEDAEANAATLAVIRQMALAPPRKPATALGYVNLVARLDPASLPTLAMQPDVVSILPYFEPQLACERQAQILAGNLSGNVPSGPGYLAWLAGKGFSQGQFDASGLVVDVTDSGVDNGTTSPNHFGLYVGGVRPGSSRVVYARLEGTPHAGSTIEGCNGHGNLDAHVIAGYNNLSGFPHADASGYHYGLGMCPFVRVGASTVFDPDFTEPDYEDLQSRAYRDGARISCNSWGSTVGGAYDSQAQRYDALARDAQPSASPVPANGNQEMVLVFATGNKGSGAGTTISPGTAKNILSIGASENVQAFGGEDASGIGDSGADNANDIIYFSSRGPCDDGRVKPDLCGPGTHVSGGVAQAATPGVNGTANPCFDGSSVSGGLYGSHFFPSGQQFFTASSGTSHSAPAVAGACALLRQYFLNQGLSVPSSAMTRAYLINSARYLNGVSANDTLPSNNQGMGAMNLGTAFDGTSRLLRDQLAQDKFTASGQSRTFSGSIPDSGKPFRVTLAWTDAPGSTTGNAYKNNLDLTIVVGGNTYKGNVFSGANSVTGSTNDSRNNCESVFLPAGISGDYTITVAATSINSDGVPNDADPLDQDFALVAYNTRRLDVTLPPNAREGDGVLSGVGTVTVTPAPTSDLAVTLASLDTSEVTVPATVTVLAGQTNAAFSVTVVDDAQLDGTQPATVTASAPSYAPGCATMAINDNETATLTVSVPASTTEGQGVLTNAGTVTLSRAPDASIVISLGSSDTSEVIVSPTVTLAAGTLSTNFTLVVGDDSRIDGTRPVTVTAHVANWTDGSGVVNVIDNENVNLTALLPAQATEGDGLLANSGLVCLSGTLPTNLTVSLSSSDTSEAIVPSSVVIPAGLTNAAFDLTIVEDSLADGIQSATITASANGFVSGGAAISVLDNDVPPAPVYPSPLNLATNVPLTADLAWSGGGNTYRLLATTIDGGAHPYSLIELRTNPVSEVLIGGTAYTPALDMSPDGELYGGMSDLRRFNPTNGTTTLIGPYTTATGSNISMIALSFHPNGTLYGLSLSFLDAQSRLCHDLYKIDTANARITQFSTVTDLVICIEFAADGTLYGSFGDLVKLDPATGRTLSRIGALSNAIVEMDFAPDGTLYGLDDDYYGLFRINPTNAAVTMLGDFDSYPHALSSYPLFTPPASAPLTTYDVYFGTNPVPGSAEFMGSTTNISFNLPVLDSLTTYYWKVVAKRTGQASSPVWRFTTTTVGPLHHFAWNSLQSAEPVNYPISVTITAQDSLGKTVPSFTDTVTLSARRYGTTNQVGTGTSPGTHPMPTYFSQSRCEAIYLTNELGGASRLTALALDVSGVPGRTMTNWTIRLKHTSRTNFVLYDSWDTNGWTQVYRTNQSITATGWNVFTFSTPFDYSGTSNLMVDFSFNNQNAVGAAYGYCRYTATGQTRVFYSDQSANTYGDPLAWYGMWNPLGFNINSLPNVRFLTGGPVAIDRATSDAFQSGVWNGTISVLETGSAIALSARDGSSHTGESNPFDVITSLPSEVLSGIAGVQGTNFTFGFTNAPGLAFMVLGTTNVALPLSNWPVIGLASELAPGQYQFTDTLGTNPVHRFYRVRWP